MSAKRGQQSEISKMALGRLRLSVALGNFIKVAWSYREDGPDLWTNSVFLVVDCLCVDVILGEGLHFSYEPLNIENKKSSAPG